MFSRTPKSSRIFCVSWEPHLASTRERLFTHYGYEVTSAVGPTQANEKCADKADLLVLGHSVPQDEKRKIVDCFRQANRAPVLSLLRPGQAKLPEVEYAIEYMNPEELVRTVNSILDRA